MKKVAFAAEGFLAIAGHALLNACRELLIAATEADQPKKRGSRESDLTGEYNYRTGRLDDGTDPYGWYERD